MTYRTAITELLAFLANGPKTYSEAKTHLHAFMNAQNPIAAPSVIREAIAGGHVKMTSRKALHWLEATGIPVPTA